MKHINKPFVCIACSIIALFMLTIIAGCDIFEENKPLDEWNEVSLPSGLKGVWYAGRLEYMTITSSKVEMNNRTWGIAHIARKEDEFRLILEQNNEYLAVYFKSLTGQSVLSAAGSGSVSIYDATQTGRTDWLELTKG